MASDANAHQLAVHNTGAFLPNPRVYLNTVWSKRNRVVALVMAFVGMGYAQAAIVYSNTTKDTLDTLAYAANGFTQMGDQILLAGTDRIGSLATVQFFNLGSVGTFDATLRLFNVGSPIGAQIGSAFSLTGIAVPANDSLNVGFDLLGLLVPDDPIFTVSAQNSSVGVIIIGLNMFEPPTVGSSDSSFAIAYNGTSFLQVSIIPNENVFFELKATSIPESSTAGIVGVLLPGVIVLHRRFTGRI